MPGAGIKIENMYAEYRSWGARPVEALLGINFEVQSGEVFGLLGPNGAGKTTLLSVLEGLHAPSAGRVLVGDEDVTREPKRVRQRLGIQLQQTALLEDLRVHELIEFYAGLYNVFLGPAQVQTLLERFDLVDKAQTYPRRLSGGQRQRLALAVAIANDPDIVLLDEPTGALDPQARRMIWALIRSLHEEGRTVLLTTHSMEEAEALCRRVAIIHRGQLVAVNTPGRLIAGLNAGAMIKVDLELPLQEIQPLPAVIRARYTGQHLEVESREPGETLAALSSMAQQRGLRLGDVSIRQPNLEDVFLQLTGQTLGNSP
jgi:ABC-2 type transport system ATP-binding protein